MGLSRNRWLVTAGVTGVAVAVVVTGAVAANATSSQPSTPPASSAAPAPAPEASTPERLGEVVDTGFPDWVIYGVPVKERALPRTHFGVMAGRRTATGKIIDVVMANEVEGPDKAPGFHAVQGAMEVDGHQTPAFGYYVGAATKITARAGGRTVVAKQAAWSADKNVKFFWFAPGSTVGGLKAYDGGRELPAGNNQVGVG